MRLSSSFLEIFFIVRRNEGASEMKPLFIYWLFFLRVSDVFNSGVFLICLGTY
jgi:hypothetical protein